MRKGNVVYKYSLDGDFICSYATTTQAARDLGLDESTIRRAANDEKKCKGFRWSRIKYPENRYPKSMEHIGIKGGWIKGGWESCLSNPVSVPLNKEEEKQLAEDSRFKNKNILVIGDLHAPFIREGYLEFCKEIYLKYQCTDVVFIGDIMDQHFSSFHEIDPDGHSAGEELRLAKNQIQKWYKAFPVAKVCLGNHDLIPQRKIFNAGVSKVWLKNIGDILDTPNWEYAEEFLIDDVLYTHGTGRKADIRMQQDLISVVQGHYHSESYIKYSVGKRSKLFALQVGCGVNDKSFAMAYGKYFAKNHINCGVVLNGGNLPVIEYMNLNK